MLSCHRGGVNSPLPVRHAPLAFALLAAILAGWGAAGPIGERVIRGDVAFQRQGDLTTITASNNSIINYRTFNIAPVETVRFVQPSADARVLNRIAGSSPTLIEGSLLANGQVYLVNPAGVYFGQNAIINVGAIYAAAGNISNSDFLRGVDRFTGLTGEVVNRGRITANTVALLGGHVANYGSIVAEKGTIMMVAGDEVLLGKRDGHLMVKVQGPAAAGSPDGAAVENAGTAEAEGGSVALGAGDVYSLAIRNVGSLKADNVTIEGQGTGTVDVRGTVDASNQAGTGGTVKVLGETVTVGGASVPRGTTIDASGALGGGTILIGGNYQGSGPERNASLTYVGPDATLRADALANGDGGRVIIWSDLATSFYGRISARGGPLGGDGGFAEISSARSLIARGSIDLSAPRGRFGTLLYDPENGQLVGGTNDGDDDTDALNNNLIHDSGSNVLGTITYTDEGVGTPNPFLIHESEIENTDANIILQFRSGFSTSGVFGGGGVTLQPGRSLTIQTRNNGGLGDAQTGINLGSVGFTTSGGGTITLITGGSAPITVAALTSGSNIGIASGGTIAINGQITATGNVTLNAGGAVSQTQPISAAGLELLGTGPYTLTNAGNNIATLAGNTGAVSFRDSGGFAIGTVNTVGLTSSGNVTLQSGAAVTQSAALVAAGLELLGTGPYTLTNAGNNITTLAGNTGAVSFRDSGGFAIGTVNTVGLTSSGNVTFQSGAAVTQTAALVATGLQLLGTGPYTLTNASNNITTLTGNTGAVSFRDIGGFDIGGLTSSGNVSLQAGGAVTQSGALTATGLELLGSGAYTLSSATNAITTLAANTTNAITYRDTDTVSLGTVGGSTGVTANGTVDITTVGTTGLTLNANINAGANAINLNGPVTLPNSASRTLTGTTVTFAGGTLTLGSDGTSFAEVLTIAGDLVMQGTSTLTAHLGTSDNQIDNLTVNGTVTLNSPVLDAHLVGGVPAKARTFQLITNNLADAVVGTFSTGGTTDVDGYTFSVTYNAGTGNDVVLQRIGTIFTWDGNGGAGASVDWSTGNNWNRGNAVPTDGDTLIFAGTDKTTNNNDLTGMTFASITFSAGGFTINEKVAGTNGITLTGGIANNSGTNVLNLPITLSGNQPFSAAAGTTLTVGGTVNGAATLTLNNPGTITFGGQVGNSTPLTGITAENNGALTFQNSLQAGTVDLTGRTGGTVAFQGDTTVTTAFTTANAAYNVSLTGTTNSIAGLTEFLNTGTVTLGNAAGDTLTFTGGLETSGNLTNPSSTTISGTVRTAGTAATLGATTVSGVSTLDTTNNGGSAVAGAVSFSGNINALNLLANHSLTIRTNSTTDAGISLQNVGNSTALGSFITNAGGGIVTLNGTQIRTTRAGGGSGLVQIGSGLKLTADTTITTLGGLVDLSTATVYCDTAGPHTLSIDTTEPGALPAGNISLSSFDQIYSGDVGTFVNRLTLTANDANGNGNLTFVGGSILLDTDGATKADLVFTGGDILVGGTTAIDTYSSGTTAAGVVNFGSSNIYATVAGQTLSLNTDRSGGTAGNITIGVVDNKGGAQQLLGGLTLSADGTTDGTITLNDSVGTSGPISFTGIATMMKSLTLRSGSGAINVASITDGASSFTLTLQDNTAASTGAVTFSGPVTVAGLTTFGQNYSVALHGGGTIGSAVNFLNTGTVTLGDSSGDSLAVSGQLTTTGNPTNPSSTRIGGTIDTSGNLLRVGTATVLADSIVNTGAGQARFLGTLNASGANHSLTINTTGTVTLSDIGTAGPNYLRALLVPSATTINVTGNVTTAGTAPGTDAIYLNGSTSIMLDAGVTTTLASGGGRIRLDGSAVQASGASASLLLDAGAGQVAIDAPITDTDITTLSIRGGPTTQSERIVLSNLVLRGAGPFTLEHASNDIAILAADTTGSISYRDADPLRVASVTDAIGTVNGITTTNQNVSLRAGDIIRIGDDTGQDINVGSGTVTLNSALNGIEERSGSTITAGALLLLSSGSGDACTLNQPNVVGTLAANVNGALGFTNNAALTIGTVGSTLGITTTADNVTLTLTGAGSLLTIGTPPPPAAGGEDISVGSASVTLNSAGGATQNAGSIINATSLILQGTGPYTLNQTNTLSNLSATVTGSVTLVNSGAITVDAATLTNGAFDLTASTVGLNANISADTGIALRGNVELYFADRTLSTGTGAGDILITGNVDDFNNPDRLFTLTAGTGDITLQGILGSPVKLESVIVNSATTLTLNRVDTTQDQSYTATNIVFNGNCTGRNITVSGATNLTLRGVTSTGDQSYTATNINLLGTTYTTDLGDNDTITFNGIVSPGGQGTIQSVNITVAQPKNAGDDTSRVIFASGSQLYIDVNAAGTVCDVFNIVGGKLDLGGTTTIVSGNLAGVAPAAPLTILTNDNTDQIKNPGNTAATLSGVEFLVNYTAGSNTNDIQIEQVGSWCVWNGNGANDLWSNAANWVGGKIPQDDVAIRFLSDPGTFVSIYDTGIADTNLSIKAIEFVVGGFNVSAQAPNAITLASGGIVNQAGTNTISIPLTLSHSQTFRVQTAAGVLNVNGAVGLGAGAGLNLQGAGAVVFGAGGSITGAQTVTVGMDSGVGSTGTATFNGPVQVSSVVVSDSKGVTFGGTLQAATVNLQNTTGGITFGGETTTTTLTVGSGAFDVSFTGTGASNRITDAVDFQNTGTLTLGDGGDTIRFDGGLTHTAGPTTINGTVRTSGGAVSLGTTTIAGISTIDTAWVSATAGQVSFSGNINGVDATATNYRLSINTDAATTDADVALQAVGNTWALGLLDVQAGTGTITLNGDVATAGALTLAGNTRIPGATTRTLASGGGTITLAGPSVQGLAAGANLTLNAGTGAVVINAPISTNITTLSITSGDGTTGTGQTQPITVTNLLLLGRGPYGLTDPSNNVDTLAANLDTGNSVATSLSFTNNGSLTVGTVSTTNGVKTTDDNVALTLTGGGSSLTIGTATVGQSIDVGAGTVTLNSANGVTEVGDGPGGNPDSIINATRLLLLGAGTFTLDQANTVGTLAANLDTGNSVATSLSFTNNGSLTIGTVGTTNGITTTADHVALTTSGVGSSLTIGTAAAGQSINVGAATVTLNSANGVTEVGDGPGGNPDSIINATNLLLLGTGAFTLEQANTVGTLAANVTGSISYTDANALAIGTVTHIDGITTTSGITATGNVTLNAGGAVTQTQVISAPGLRLLGTGPYTLGLANTVGTLAANLDTGASVATSLSFTNNGSLTVGTVGTTNGITTTADDVTLTLTGATSLLTIGTSGVGQSVSVGAATVTLNSAGGVTEVGDGAGVNPDSIINATNLLLLGSGTFTLNQANTVGTLAAETTGAITYRDLDALTIGTLGGKPGIKTNGGALSITSTNTTTTNPAANVDAGAGTVDFYGTVTVPETSIAGAEWQITGSTVTFHNDLQMGTPWTGDDTTTPTQRLIINGNLALSDTATLHVQIGSTNESVDKITVNGSVALLFSPIPPNWPSLDAKLVDLDNPPDTGTTFTVITNNPPPEPAPDPVFGLFRELGQVDANSHIFGINYAAIDGNDVQLSKFPSTRYWDGGAASPLDANWMNRFNWEGDARPVAGDTLVFTGTVKTTTDNNFPTATSFAVIRFATDVLHPTFSDFTLNGAAIALTQAIDNNIGSNAINLQTGLNGITVASGATFTALGGTTLNLNSPVTANAALAITGAGTTNVNGAVTLNAALTLTNSGPVNFTNSVDGAQTATLNGAGLTTFSGQVGNATPLNTLDVQNTGGLTFTNTFNAATVNLQATNTGAVAFQDNADITTALNVPGGAFPVSFTGGATNVAGPAATTFSNTGGLTLGNGDGDVLTFSAAGGLNTGTNAVSAQGTVRTNGQPMSIGLGGGLTVPGGTLILATNNTVPAGNTLTVGAVTAGGNNLTLNAGAGGAVTVASLASGGTLTLQNAASFAFTGDVTANTLATTANPYSVAFTGGGTITTDTNFLSTGAVTLGNDVGDSLTFTGGLDTTGGPSGTNLAGTVATANNQMDLGATTMTANATLKSGSAALNVASMTGAFTLSLQENTAGFTGPVTFSGPVTITGLATFGQGYSVAFLGGGTITTATTFLNAGGLTLGNGNADTLTFVGGVSTGTNAVSAQGTVQTNGQPMSVGTGVGGSLTLSGPAGTLTLATNNTVAAGNPLAVGPVTGGGNSLTLNGGTAGAVSVQSVAGVDTLDVAHSGGTTFLGPVAANTVTLTNTNGTIAFQGDTTVNTALTTAGVGYSVSFTGTTNNIAGLTNFLNTGQVTLGNGGDTITFVGGVRTAGNVTNPSVTNVAGTVQTTDALMNLGPVTLAGASTLDTGTGAASTMNVGAVTGGGFDLTLDSGHNAAADMAIASAAGVNTLTLLDSGGATFAGPVGANAVALTDTNGTIAFQGNLVVGAGGLTTTAQPYSIDILGTTNTIAGLTTFLNTGVGTLLRLGDGGDAADSIQFTDGFTTVGGPAETRTAATITTVGAPADLGVLNIAGNTTFQTGAGKLTFHEDIGNTAAGHFFVNTAAGSTGDIEFMSNVNVNGAVTLGTDLFLPPNIARIYKRSQVLVDPDPNAFGEPGEVVDSHLVINTNGNEFRMGVGQKLTVTGRLTNPTAVPVAQVYNPLGNLTINTGAADAYVGDLSASGTITVQANHIYFRGRGLSEVLVYQGVSLTPRTDTNMDIVAREIRLLAATGVSLETPGNPVFLSTLEPTAANITVSGTGYTITPIPGIIFSPTVRGTIAGDATYPEIPAGTALDLLAGYAPVLPILALTEEPPIIAVAGEAGELSPALRELLQLLGIYARESSEDEKAALSARVPVVAFDDTVKNDEPRDYDYTMAAARLPGDLVKEVADNFKGIFYSKEGKFQPDLVKGPLQKAFEAYKGTAQQVDPLEFRRFVEKTKGHEEALRVMDGTRRLFVQIANLGLTDVQLRNAKLTIVRQIVPAGATPDQLIRAIEGGDGGAKVALKAKVRGGRPAASLAQVR